MIRYKGGEKVRRGEYWCFSTGKILSIPKEGGILPGNMSYIRLPVAGLLLMAPILGLVYVVFLPFIGFAMVFYHLGLWMLSGIVKAGESLLGVITYNLVPGYAYFTKKNKENAKAKNYKEIKSSSLDAIEEEIEERKKAEEI